MHATMYNHACLLACMHKYVKANAHIREDALPKGQRSTATLPTAIYNLGTLVLTPYIGEHSMQ